MKFYRRITKEHKCFQTHHNVENVYAFESARHILAIILPHIRGEKGTIHRRINEGEQLVKKKYSYKLYGIMVALHRYLFRTLHFIIYLFLFLFMIHYFQRAYDEILLFHSMACRMDEMNKNRNYCKQSALRIIIPNSLNKVVEFQCC